MSIQATPSADRSGASPTPFQKMAAQIDERLKERRRAIAQAVLDNEAALRVAYRDPSLSDWPRDDIGAILDAVAAFSDEVERGRAALVAGRES